MTCCGEGNRESSDEASHFATTSASEGRRARNRSRAGGDNARMTQGKRISADIGGDALQAIKDFGAAARRARTTAGEGQSAAAARLGVHVQTIGRIEAGEPGVAIGHVLGLLALYGVGVRLQEPEGR
jgi:HTH-type transcriptional regulator/antitoxin HipB